MSLSRPARVLARGITIVALVGGCEGLPGRPKEGHRPLPPAEVSDFGVLYEGNCAGCHGDPERPGAAVRIADPLYLTLIDDTTLRRITADGVPGSLMPGFAESAGGMLTDSQIGSLVSGMRSTWGRQLRPPGAPPYAAASPGNATRGAAVFATSCANCHGPAGTGGPRGGSVVDGSYLALVSDQNLRTTVLVGRPSAGMPDWRSVRPGAPLSEQEIDDVVAWLASQRRTNPGQPYPSRDPESKP